MSDLHGIRVEGDKLLVEYWIERIHYTPAQGGRTLGEDGVTSWARDSLAVIVTEGGTFSLVGEKADALRPHRLTKIQT